MASHTWDGDAARAPWGPRCHPERRNANVVADPGPQWGDPRGAQGDSRGPLFLSQVWAQVRGAEERVWALRFCPTPLRGEPQAAWRAPLGPGRASEGQAHPRPRSGISASLLATASFTHPNGAGRQDRCWGSGGTSSVCETAQSGTGCVNTRSHPRASTPAPPTHGHRPGQPTRGHCPGDRGSRGGAEG